MADIEKIQVGDTTYDINDILVRTYGIKVVSTRDNSAESTSFNAGTRVKKYNLYRETFATWCSCLFAVYRAFIYRKDDGYHWTEIKISGLYRDSNDASDIGEGYAQKLYAIGKCGGAMGPSEYSLTCCDNIDLTETTGRWTFYVTCGQKFSTRYHHLDLFLFNSKHLDASSIGPSVSNNWETI